MSRGVQFAVLLLAATWCVSRPQLRRNAARPALRNGIGTAEMRLWHETDISSQVHWSRIDNLKIKETREYYVIIIIIIIIISFMQGIYTYIPETNYVPVAAVLLLLFMVLISLVSVLNLLYFYNSTFRSMCAVPNMAVFCSSLTSCFPSMLLTYLLNDWNSPSRPYYYWYYYYYYYYYGIEMLR